MVCRGMPSRPAARIAPRASGIVGAVMEPDAEGSQSRGAQRDGGLISRRTASWGLRA